jgi:hypothetical protein
MSDLISRSALIEEFVEATNKGTSELWHITGIKAFIENAPTVEAIPKAKLDEIVEKLEELKNDFENKNFDKKHCQKMIYLKTCLGRNCFECVLNGAIKIVKGVINERD